MDAGKKTTTDSLNAVLARRYRPRPTRWAPTISPSSSSSPEPELTMDNFRSRSSVDWRAREGAGVYGGEPAPPHGRPYDLRSYSMCHVPAYPPPMAAQAEAKKGRTSVGRSPSLRSCLSLSDPEMQRKRRVAGYKMYAAEGKIKTTVRKSFKWLKNRYAMVVYGW